MDIQLTERINADLKNLFRAYQSAIDCNIVASMTDLRGVIIHANEHFCQLSGYKEGELIGARHSIINSGHHSREFFQQMWQTIASGQTWRGDICNRAKDGRLYWVDSTILPVHNDRMEIIGFLSLRIEITDKVELRQKLERMNSSLEEMIKLKSSQLHIKNRDMMASLRYAQRIQNALMPSKDAVLRVLPQSFILYRPKAVVSGDFYFFHHSNGTVHFAAADGTGHGVPGAFLSILGTEKLENALMQSTDTGRILTILNQGIHASLGRADAEQVILDGLELALCRLDLHTGTLQFSGANRPLWILRKGADTIEEIRGDRSCVCESTDNDYPFTTVEKQLYDGDTVYIFSDGFADTYDESGKHKLKRAGFRDLLLKVAAQSMAQQHDSLNNFLNSYIGQGRQTDDILVFGVRYHQHNGQGQ
jgi:PAS domain S-box-containing protein